LPRSVTRVVRRGNVFCFRMAVPRHLRVHIGRHEIKLSLRTSDPCTGNVRGRILSNVLDLLFAELSRMQPLSTQTLNERARDYFQQALNRSLEHTFLLPLDPSCDLNAEVQSLQERVGHLRSQLAAQAFSPNVRKEAEALLEPPGGTGDPNSDHYQYACNLILRGKIEEARILAAQLSGDYTAASPRDPLFAGMVATGLPPLPGDDASPSKQQNQFGQVADQFFEFKVKHDWVKKTAADVKRVLDLAVVLIGSGKPIHLVDVQDVKDVRDALAKLPPNYMKLGANKGVSVKEIIAANKSGGGLSVKTQDKYFTMFRQLLIWAANEGLIDKVPGAGVKVAGVGKTNPADQRDPLFSRSAQNDFQFAVVCRSFIGNLSSQTWKSRLEGRQVLGATDRAIFGNANGRNRPASSNRSEGGGRHLVPRRQQRRKQENQDGFKQASSAGTSHFDRGWLFRFRPRQKGRRSHLCGHQARSRRLLFPQLEQVVGVAIRAR